MPLGIPSSSGQPNNIPAQLVRVSSADNINDYVDFDVVERESHIKQSLVSKYPVEKGAQIADHMLPMPNVIRFKGIVSQTPDMDTSPKGPHANEPVTRVSQARTTMIKYRDQSMLVTVSTFREVYENMVVMGVDEDVTYENGNDFEATITCMQISVATAQFAQAPNPKTPAATNKKDLSSKTLGDDGKNSESGLSKWTGAGTPGS